MNRHYLVTSGAALFFALVICFVPGCSDNDCPTVPDPGTGGVSLSSTVLTPQPMPSVYGGIYVAGTQDLFVAAAFGVVLRHQGTTWITYKTGVLADLHGIWGTSAGDVFAVGDGGTVVHFDGTSWREMNSGVFEQLNAVHGTASDDVCAVGANGTLVHYDGTGWSPVDTSPFKLNRTFRDIWCAPTGELFIVDQRAAPDWDGAVLIYDGVSAWTETVLSPSYTLCVWGAAADNVWIGIGGGEIHHFNGTAWSLVHTMPDVVSSMHGTGPGDLWAVGSTYSAGESRGVLYHFNGTSWLQTGIVADPPPYERVATIATDEVYVIGGSTMVLAWDGANWTLTNDAWVTSDYFEAMWGNSGNDIWLTGEQGTAFNYDGTGWTKQYAGAEEYTSAMWGAADDDIYAVGEHGTIVHYDGGSWSEISHGLGDVYLTEIWGTASDDIWVGCTWDGYLWHYNGSAWTSVAVWDPFFGRVKSLWGAASDDYYAVVENQETLTSGVLHYDGSTWEPIGLGGHYARHVHGVSSSEVYFTTRSAYLMITSAGGNDRTTAIPGQGSGALLRYHPSTGTTDTYYIGASIETLWALGHNNVFVAGTRDRSTIVGHFDGSQVVFHEPDAYFGVRDMWGTGTNTVYICGALGSLLQVRRN